MYSMMTSEEDKRSSNIFGTIYRAIKKIGGSSTEEEEAFCLRCKVKTPMKNAVAGILSNGTGVVRGECSICSKRVSRITKRK